MWQDTWACTRSSPLYLHWWGLRLEMAHIIKDKVGAEHEIVFQIIRDSNVAAIMSEVDCVLIGAEGVVESGGIINTVRPVAMCSLCGSIGKGGRVRLCGHCRGCVGCVWGYRAMQGSC